MEGKEEGNCLDIQCPRCGNAGLHRLKDRNSKNHGKVKVFICDYCGEEFGGPLEETELRMRRD